MKGQPCSKKYGKIRFLNKKSLLLKWSEGLFGSHSCGTDRNKVEHGCEGGNFEKSKSLRNSTKNVFFWLKWYQMWGAKKGSQLREKSLQIQVFIAKILEGRGSFSFLRRMRGKNRPDSPRKNLCLSSSFSCYSLYSYRWWIFPFEYRLKTSRKVAKTTFLRSSNFVYFCKWNNWFAFAKNTLRRQNPDFQQNKIKKVYIFLKFLWTKLKSIHFLWFSTPISS